MSLDPNSSNMGCRGGDVVELAMWFFNGEIAGAGKVAMAQNGELLMIAGMQECWKRSQLLRAISKC
jgi:hypothetical protein